MQVIQWKYFLALLLLQSGLVTIRGRVVPEINNEDNGYNNKIENNVVQKDHTQLKDELSILLRGPWMLEFQEYLKCIQQKADFIDNKNNEVEDTDSNEISDDYDEVPGLDINHFLEESLKIATSSKHAPGKHTLLQKRDDHYGAGQCGTFAIFPFLAFLASAVASSLTVMANVNTNINNNNNNNNNNQNENMNMNMNMNARQLSIREAADDHLFLAVAVENAARKLLQQKSAKQLHQKSGKQLRAAQGKTASRKLSRREADEQLNLAGLVEEAAGIIFQNSQSLIPGFKPVFMQKINKRSPVHILPNQNGRHLPPLTPPPRPVYPRRRPTQQPPTSTASTTELSTTTDSTEDTTTSIDHELSQDSYNSANDFEVKKGISIQDNITMKAKDNSNVVDEEKLTNEDINEQKENDEVSNVLSTKSLLSEEKVQPSLTNKAAGKPGNLAAGHTTSATTGQSAPDDEVANTLVPNLAETWRNIKLGLEKDIDSFKILGLPSVGEIKASLSESANSLNILSAGSGNYGITPRKFLPEFLRFPDLLSVLSLSQNQHADESLSKSAQNTDDPIRLSAHSADDIISLSAQDAKQLRSSLGYDSVRSSPDLRLLRLALQQKVQTNKKSGDLNDSGSNSKGEPSKPERLTSELAENDEDKKHPENNTKIEADHETSKSNQDQDNVEDKISANPLDIDETDQSINKDEVHLTMENVDKDLQSLIDKGSIYMLDDNGDIRKVIKHEESPTSAYNGGIHPSLEHNNGGINTRERVQTTTEGYEFSRILPGDPINSILGFLSNSGTKHPNTEERELENLKDTESINIAGGSGILNFLPSSYQDQKKVGQRTGGFFNLLGSQKDSQEAPARAGGGLLNFLTPPKVPSLGNIQANIRSLWATEKDPEKLESRNVRRKPNDKGLKKEAIDIEAIDTDSQEREKYGPNIKEGQLSRALNASRVRYYDVNYDDQNENKDDYLSSREEKKIFDESSKNMIDNKLDLMNKQIDHKNFAAFSLSSLLNSQFQNLVNQTMDFSLFKHISEDFSKVSEIVQNRTRMLAQDRNFNSSTLKSEWDNLHFTNHVKNASEEIKKFRLPGLPSIGDIWDKSRNISSKLENITSIVSPLTVLRTLTSEMSLSRAPEIEAVETAMDRIDINEPQYQDQDLTFVIDSRTLTPDEEEAILSLDIQDEIGDLSLEEYLMKRFMNLVNSSIGNLKYSLGEASKVFGQEKSTEGEGILDNNVTNTFTVKNISYSLLQGLDSLPVPSALQGLVNPEVDVHNIEKVLRILPHLFPYIMQDYKERFHGLFVGTQLSQEQLFEIHGSLVDWHNKIESVRGELPIGQIHRILGLLQENNLVLMSLVLHLMAEAGGEDQGMVDINHHHLKVIDRHLLKAEDLFPGLKDLLYKR